MTTLVGKPWSASPDRQGLVGKVPTLVSDVAAECVDDIVRPAAGPRRELASGDHPARAPADARRRPRSGERVSARASVLRLADAPIP